MNRLLLPLALLAACSPEITLSDDDPILEGLPTAHAPPPFEIELEAGNFLERAFGRLTAHGLPTDTDARIVWARRLGAGPCPSLLDGRCVGLAGPVRVSPISVASLDGSALFGLRVPAGREGSTVAVQLGVTDGAPMLSNPIIRLVGPAGTLLDDDVDNDGDGYSPAEGDCADFDTSYHPDADDVIGDGLDPNCDNVDGYDADDNGCEDTVGCTVRCGDGRLGGAEACDDDNLASGDGCAADCTVEANTVCADEPSVCDTDATPDSFDLPNVTDVTRSTLTLSAVLTVGGFYGDIPASVTGDGAPELLKNGSPVGGGTSVSPGDTLQIRLTSASSYRTAATVTLNLNGVTDTWTVTTEGSCHAAPEVFSTAGAFSVTAPAGCPNVRFDAWGAGGGADASTSSVGGGGGYLQASYTTVEGEVFSLTVGAGGARNASSRVGGGGGGGTGVVRSGTTLLVAGGGGGAGNGANGGPGGGATGTSGSTGGCEPGFGGTGGTLVAPGSGGAGGRTWSAGVAGSARNGGNGGGAAGLTAAGGAGLGNGGNGADAPSDGGGGGGGGGWFGGGGGGGGCSGGGGGGGSSNASGASTFSTASGAGRNPGNAAQAAGAGLGGQGGAGAAGRIVVTWLE
jgi:cysteine-rich repeat protein